MHIDPVASHTSRPSAEIEAKPERVAAILITPTCNLEKGTSWTFCPIQLLAGEPNLSRGTLFSQNGYHGLFGLPVYPGIVTEEAYVDFSQTVCVNKVLTPISARILSLGREATFALGTKLANYFGRDWGYAEGETIEEGGHYRCRICAASYGITLHDRELRRGDPAPRCSECSDRGRRASWAKLIQAKQKQLPFPTVPQ